MADLRKEILNGIVQTKETLFDPSKYEAGKLYFVRTDGKGSEGYVFLNGRKYGNVEEVRELLNDALGTLPSGKTVSDLIEELQNSVENLDEAVEVVEGEVASANTKIAANEKAIADANERIDQNENDIDKLEDAVASANTHIANIELAIDDLDGRVAANEADIETLKSDVETLNADSATTGSVDQKIADAIAKLPEDMFVESGRVETVSGKTYLVLTIKGGHEVWVPADKLVDTYKSGDEFINIDGYVITLNVENLKEALNIANLATKDEVKVVSDKVNETISALTEVQDAVEEMDGELAAVSAKTLDNEKAIASAQTEIDSNKTAIAELEDRADNVDATLSAMSGTMENMQEEIEEIESKSQKLVAGKGIEIDSANTISANSDAVTTDDIMVTVNLGAGITKDTTIPAGTSIQDLLVKLLSKELWDTTTPTTSTAFTVALASGFAVSLNKSGNVEVGDLVTVNTLNAKATSTHSQSYTVKSFDYGYKIGADGTYTAATAYTENLTPTKAASGNILSETFTGFVDADNNAIASRQVTADTLAAISAYAVEGTNSVAAKETGDTYASATADSKSFYVATNLKNYTKSSADSSDNIYVATPSWTASMTATGSSSASVTGCYKYYYGYVTALNDYSSLITLKTEIPSDFTGVFMTSDTATIEKMESTDEKQSHVLVVPASYTITGTKNSMNISVDLDKTWSKVNTFNYINGNSNIEYAVYVNASNSAIVYKEITFKK